MGTFRGRFWDAALQTDYEKCALPTKTALPPSRLCSRPNDVTTAEVKQSKHSFHRIRLQRLLVLVDPMIFFLRKSAPLPHVVCIANCINVLFRERGQLRRFKRPET